MEVDERKDVQNCGAGNFSAPPVIKIVDLPQRIAFSFRGKDANALLGREGAAYCLCRSDSDTDSDKSLKSGKAYVFGGSTKEGLESNELVIIRNDEGGKFVAEKVEICGDRRPKPRVGACLASVGNRLYMFGGCTQSAADVDVTGGCYFNDFWSFQLPNGPWQEGHLESPSSTRPPSASLLRLAPVPSPRDKATMVSIGKQLWLFGGFGPGEGENLDDADQGNSSAVIGQKTEGEEDMADQVPLTLKWFDDLYCIETTASGEHGDIYEVRKPMQLNLACPTARAAHAATSTAGSIIIFGGRDISGSRTNDLYIFDVKSRKWAAYLPESDSDDETEDIDTPNENEAGDNGDVGSNSGSKENCKINSGVKQRVVVAWPPARSYSSICTFGPNDRFVVVFGGRDEIGQPLGDFWVFDTLTESWQRVGSDVAFMPRFGALLWPVLNDHLAVLLGCTEELDDEEEVDDEDDDYAPKPPVALTDGFEVKLAIEVDENTVEQIVSADAAEGELAAKAKRPRLVPSA